MKGGHTLFKVMLKRKLRGIDFNCGKCLFIDGVYGAVGFYDGLR